MARAEVLLGREVTVGRCWVGGATRAKVLGRRRVEGGVGGGSGVARPARIGRSGAGRGAARVGVSVGPKWRGLRPAEGWAAVGGSGSVFEAIGLAAEEVTGIGSRSVRAGRGSGFVKGGAGVRREAGPVASTRLALKRAGRTFKTIAGAKRRRGTRVFEGGTKRGTLRGRWGE